MLAVSKFKEFSISDLFDIVYGNGDLTKAYIHNNPGPYPVFGATSDPDKVAGYINTHDFSRDALSFVRIGYAGHVAHRAAPFSITCNVLALAPKEAVASLLHLPYFAPVVSSALRRIATGRFKADGRQDYTQINQSMALRATIDVPVKEDGTIDLEEQRVLAARYEKVGKVKVGLVAAAGQLADLGFAVPMDGIPTITLKLADAFDLARGNSKYTEKYAREHVGSYPLYTAATRNVVPDHIDTFDHEVEALHYTTEGAHAGTVFHRMKHKFSMSGHAGILTKKVPEISYSYALFEVTRVFNAQGFRWASNIPSKTKISDLELRFPVDVNGKLDTVVQDTIAKRMHRLSQQRDETVQDIRRLAKVEVTFEAA